MSREYILPDCISFYLMSIYSLKDFDTRQQIERDLHMGKIQWIVNHALERNFYKNKFVDAVDIYMKRNTKTSYEELLKLTDFSAFEP